MSMGKRTQQPSAARVAARYLKGAVSLRKGMSDLPGGGQVHVKPMPRWQRKETGRKLRIIVWPEDSEKTPDRKEEARLLKEASAKLGAPLEWEGEWTSSVAGFYREANPGGKATLGRSRAIGKWLDKEIEQTIDKVYRDYDAGRIRKEPSLTASVLLHMIGGGPSEWSELTNKGKVGRIQKSLQRLHKKGVLNTSVGLSNGREARLYEPMWWARENGNV